MKTDALRDQVKDYYERQHMSPEKVARLTSMLRAAGHPRDATERPGYQRRLADWIASLGPRLIPAAAMALVVMVALNVGVWYHWNGFSKHRIHANIAREIAMNHVKNLAPEYQAITIEVLGRVMPALDFQPYSPNLLSQLGLKLKGARYCSIQGHLALQMKLHDTSGQRYTIYQAPYLPPLHQIQRTNVSIDDIQITMWNEQGIFIGLAGPERTEERKFD